MSTIDRLADIILKHDGYIWGEYAWSKVCDFEVDTTIRCRFVSKGLFNLGDTFSVPQNFFVDLQNTFQIVSVKKSHVKIYDGEKEYSIFIHIHCSVDEISFMESTDFTCNLLDYRRDGIMLRNVPLCIAYEVNPFNTVVQHIKHRNLVPVCIKSACETYKYYKDIGWDVSDTDIRARSVVCSYENVNNFHYKKIEEDTCSICNSKFSGEDSCIRTNCLHVYHVDCIKDWFEKKVTCPNCRENVY